MAEIVGGVFPPITLKMADALVAAWPSGFVIVKVCPPEDAFATAEMCNVRCAGSVYWMLLTVMPKPLKAAAIRLENPAPGSKKPEPFVKVPVTVTVTLFDPAAIVAGLQLAGVAGGGANNFAT